jgi:hypothetical protein
LRFWTSFTLVARVLAVPLELPAHGKGVGRATSIAVIPPLESLVGGQKIRALENAGSGRLREGIATSLACGYLGLAALKDVTWERKPVKPRPELEMDAAQVWGPWVAQLGAGALDSLTTPDSVASDRTLEAVRKYASGRFTDTLGELGLMPKRLKRMRLKLVDAWYVEAGMILRLVQGSSASIDSSSVPAIVDRLWPFHPAPS